MSNWRIDKECTIDIFIGDDYHEVTFTRNTTIEAESNWGADADGNRGDYREFIGDDYAEEIKVDGKPITEFTPDLQIRIQEEVNAWIRDNEPEE